MKSFFLTEGLECLIPYHCKFGAGCIDASISFEIGHGGIPTLFAAILTAAFNGFAILEANLVLLESFTFDASLAEPTFLLVAVVLLPKEIEMSRLIFWIGIVCMILGALFGLLSVVGVIALSKPVQIITLVVVVVGGILVSITWSQSRRAG